VDNDTDNALVERYRNGDRAAFTELVIRYQRPIYNAAFWVLRKAEDANDVTQDVFLKVAERLDEYDGQHRFFSWIYRIAINESLNLLRRNNRDDELDDEIDLPGPDTANPERQASDAQVSRRIQTALMGMSTNDRTRQASDAQVSRRIQTALMGMSTNDRTVLTLRHFSECSYEEIGQILGLDEKTVKSRLFDARRRLRDLLRDLAN